MLTEPLLVTRAAQFFAAIELELAQPEIAATAPPLIADVMKWAEEQGLSFAGPPFFNYFEFLPGGRMKMQVGRTVDRLVDGDRAFVTGELPAGRYASITHTGPYRELYEANMALDHWCRANGYVLAGHQDGHRFVGATRLEIYHRDAGTDPLSQPTTEVAFRLAD